MAYVSSFVFCDQIRTELDANNHPIRNIVTPLSELKPISIPGNYTFAIACTINEFDAVDTNSFIVKIITPTGKESIVFTASIPPIPQAMYKNGNPPANVNVDMDLRNIVFTEEGKHEIVVFLNDSIITKQTLMVSKGE